MLTAVLYCLQFSRELGDAEVERIARTVLDRPFSDLTAEEQYADLEAALATDDWERDLAWQPHDAASVRQFLRRLLARLDALRPWAEPPYRALGLDRWHAYRCGTPLAHVRLRAPSQDVLHARLRTVPDDPHGLRAVVLRLRSGDEVALVAAPLPDGYDAVLLAVAPHRPAAEVTEAFVTHTGCPPDRVTPARRRPRALGGGWRGPLPPGVTPRR
ncbi:hypothetical protein WN71_037820 [Streptomyces mangrovisoli]|uniref:Uncharacterized protein n=1 Tax=Streptomyces mangrovisoli TaxID=1428628 RepID=A0A1J4NK54_9ACTN|nr:hypothetical protein WN71_037820 [Streptomyces mangrovisoli]